MRLRTIDRRMNGYGQFKYFVELRKEYDRSAFIAIRNWCWEQWGPSCELEFYEEEVNPHWAWNVTEFRTRIYIASDKEASWFMLKWI